MGINSLACCYLDSADKPKRLQEKALGSSEGIQRDDSRENELRGKDSMSWTVLGDDGNNFVDFVRLTAVDSQLEERSCLTSRYR
jgi:hypothetical protein